MEHEAYFPLQKFLARDLIDVTFAITISIDLVVFHVLLDNDHYFFA